MIHLSVTRKAYLMLLVASIVWGVAFVAQRDAMQWMPPFLFNACRFGLAAIALFFVLLRTAAGSPPAPSSSDRYSGVILGLLLWLGASLQQAGMVYTTAGKAGFITSLYMVVVPLILFLAGRRVSIAVWCGVFLATVGLCFLSATDDLSINKGDALVLACACAFAMHVVFAEVFTRRVNPYRLALVQYTTCAVLSLMTAFVVEPVGSASLLPALPSILYGGLISIAVGYTLQLSAQRHVPAAPAALILSLEAVFAVLAGSVLLGETLTAREMIGCAMMLAGIVLAQKPLARG
jgi:drug/metabolite transporter (DMT)-like permease